MSNWELYIVKCKGEVRKRKRKKRTLICVCNSGIKCFQLIYLDIFCSICWHIFIGYKMCFVGLVLKYQDKDIFNVINFLKGIRKNNKITCKEISRFQVLHINQMTFRELVPLTLALTRYLQMKMGLSSICLY